MGIPRWERLTRPSVRSRFSRRDAAWGFTYGECCALIPTWPRCAEITSNGAEICASGSPWSLNAVAPQKTTGRRRESENATMARSSRSCAGNSNHLSAGA
ncbi:hypothetical protein GCM10009670_14770 [Citricoccus alkalitolerans]